MLLGVYGDVHLTKNMRSLQGAWEDSVKKSINHMYDHFDELGVEVAVCLGDFFDSPRIEAKNMELLIPILELINSRTYPTYILLGNHEIDSEESNVLEYLSVYDHIYPVTKVLSVENLLFIPYNVDPILLEIPSDSVVFTHHDIYGSELAGGKTKAFFGVDPNLFSHTGVVFNGHVHLKSKVSEKIINAGSLLTSAHGELRAGDYPSYYTIDTKTLKINEYENKNSLIYLTVPVSDLDLVSEKYDLSRVVMRVEYKGELPQIPMNTLHTSHRKIIDSIEDKQTEKVQAANFDLRNYLVEYIKKDQSVSESDKESYINTVLELVK